MNQIEALIDQIAAEYGVPGWVARAIAYGENSSFNPKLVGDNGASIGIFQVHQVNETSVAKRQNAEWNIRWAMQNSVGPAYKQAIAQGITDPSQLLTYIWTNGQKAAAWAIPGGVERAMGYLGGEATPTGGTEGTEGEITVATKKQIPFFDWLVENGYATPAKTTTWEDGTTSEIPAAIIPGFTSIIPDLRAEWAGTSTADTGTATTTTQTTIPSPQEAAVSKFDMETALNEAVLDWNKFGADVATQNFTNKLNAAQEGRLQATAAQEYAMNLAPPGMTEFKLGNMPAMPLGGYMPSTYSEAMQQANVPQAPEIPMPQQPTMPQMPNLGALPASSTQTSYQTQVPYAQGALPTTGGGNAGEDSTYMQAVRNVMQRLGLTIGAGVSGGNLPVGR